MTNETQQFTQQFTVTADAKDKQSRVDKCLARHIPSLSRSFIQKLIEQGYATLNEEIIVRQASQKIKFEDVITLVIPPPTATEMLPADIPLDIEFEDNDFLVVNKAVGMTVHPGAGHYQDTLANALLFHCKDNLSGIGGVERPGIVHRLDKDTSGLMLAAKTDTAHRVLSEKIAQREVSRIYHAICFGVPRKPSGTIDTQIGRHTHHRQRMAVLPSGGKQAVTHYRVIETFHGIASLVECRLQTGRTHQIRVHLTHIGHPLVGDPVYGKAPSHLPEALKVFLKTFQRQALHSYSLGLAHPISKEALSFICPMPEDMQSLIGILQ
jgi:23S rRNA pseudouridine1911/1915/1917 synthase